MGVIKIIDKNNDDDWWWLISMKNSIGLLKWNDNSSDRPTRISKIEFTIFYRAMLAQGAVMRLHVVRPSVCPSVRPSVTFRYRDQNGIIRK